jgi:hypothetical protein
MPVCVLTWGAVCEVLKTIAYYPACFVDQLSMLNTSKDDGSFNLLW